MPYQVALKKFNGPLETLLALIEARELEITEISLAEVTNDFLKYLKTLRMIEARVLADFIAIASRLILIKSKSLLPNLRLTETEEHDIKELEERLRIYKSLQPLRRTLERLSRAGNAEFGRQYFAIPSLALLGGGIFYPATNADGASMARALDNLLHVFRRLVSETETIKEKILSLEEKIEEIIARLTKQSEARFSHFTREKPRSEIIITFLALLHLARESLISLEQGSHASDIMIKKIRA